VIVDVKKVKNVLVMIVIVVMIATVVMIVTVMKIVIVEMIVTVIVMMMKNVDAAEIVVTVEDVEVWMLKQLVKF
jgi:hypothetical protein